MENIEKRVNVKLLTHWENRGYFKDENNGDILEKFVGLRSKMYAFTVGEKFVAKAKGVKKSVTKKKL
ncbi:unnamed protein product [Euphydryas editha]|uniref:Uncharacterized protein n=1 Tax=Euphydryas editha TaxID=104508 RepID=A0AAU9VFB6_EUPED|nr:unnamed protein product [Euphydryas editha]